MSTTGNEGPDIIKRETLKTIRTYLEIVVIVVLGYGLWFKDKQVTNLQEKLYNDSQEGLKYWRELNEKSNEIMEASRTLREIEAEIKRKKADSK